jgi:hypothetical protein
MVRRRRTRRSEAGGVYRRVLVRSVLGVLVSLGTASACGGGTTSPSVDASAGQRSEECEAGDTRECIGPGACRGGQFCRMGAWETCQCRIDCCAGAPGLPASAEGGEANASGGAAGSGSIPPGEGGAAGQPDEQIWQDDPCDGVQNTCYLNACGSTSPGLLVCRYIDDKQPGPADDCGFTFPNLIEVAEDETYPIFRTPKASVFPAHCQCPQIASRLDLVVQALGSSSLPKKGHFTVRRPWHFGGCASASQCTQTPTVVWTDTIDAPEVNIYYSPGPCPD